MEAESSPRRPHAPAPGTRRPQREERKGGRGSPGGDAVHRRLALTPTVDHACEPSPVEAHGYDVAASQHATCPGRPGLDRPNPSPPEPFETQS